MEVIRATGGVPYESTAVALGNFDGLHVAHINIINQCKKYAHERGLKCGVLLFNNHTQRTTHGSDVKIITNEAQKLRILEEAGIDFVYMRDFDKEFMQLSPEEFIRLLIERLRMKAVFVGYDYRFGYMAKGSTKLLEKLGYDLGFEVTVVDEIDHNGVTVKSTAIRHYVEDGSVQHAANMLGRPFAIEGRVVRGLRNGTKMGVPTANIEYSDNMLIPHTGVYAGYTTVDGEKYASVINVGNNPTFGADRITIESHILDFTGDLYDKTICVEFIKRIRGEKRFYSIEALKAQIHEDTIRARKELSLCLQV
ncbi:MAG: bifunctional riboflavin kinase/FAD synthetase [Clostridia bacterium]|nr:bifunctional riboflavin kinase/FAD synthetase [Clostridia bacterium]